LDAIMTSPVIPSIDLSEIPCAQIDVSTLLGSDAWLLASDSPAIGFALINLMLRSWHQVPAASVPSNDQLLAKYAGLDPDTWAEVKGTVLRDWIACDDGRLYHPMIAKRAYEAGEARAKHAAFIESQRLKGKKSGAARAAGTANKSARKAADKSAPTAIEAESNASIPAAPVSPRQVSIFDAKQHAAGQAFELVEAAPKPAAAGSKASEIDQACEAIFEHYKKRLHPRAKFGPDRKKLLRKWLKTKPSETDKYTVDELMQVIDGNADSAWHQGANKQQTAYNEFEYIFRDRQHIETFQKIARGEAQQNATPAARLSTGAQQTLEALKRRQERRQDRGDDSTAGELQ